MKRLLSLTALTATSYVVVAEIATTYIEIQPLITPWCWFFGQC